jgi:hypothetical protein
MALNFMEFKDENNLQHELENYLKLGSATIEDVFLFAERNGLQCSELQKNGANTPQRFRKHEATIQCSAPAPTGAKKFFSNWRNIFRAWQVLFYSATWLIEFHFDDHTLSEIYVDKVYTSL